MCFTTHTFWSSAADQFRPPIFRRLQDLQRSAFWNKLARVRTSTPEAGINWREQALALSRNQREFAMVQKARQSQPAKRRVFSEPRNRFQAVRSLQVVDQSQLTVHAKPY